ncbi:hypothetical protein F0562_003686 [Nyssa sinensis]|uniref:Uncharacterized protein n=1 Tax=Nyssa sinensis TaxID=561372 RepID=A0A5J5BZU6_9ASTE|nr:hypothetical protein F0562_003686 [Nyssa sinensis]
MGLSLCLSSLEVKEKKIVKQAQAIDSASSSTLIYSIPLRVMADETMKTDVLEAPEASKEVPAMTEKEEAAAVAVAARAAASGKGNSSSKTVRSK